MLINNEKTNTIYTYKQLSDWLSSYWIYIAIYVFFLYVSFTTARAGDDWEISQWYQDGFISSLAGMIRATTYFNGRISANLFGSFFAYYDFLWRFSAPLVFTSIIYFSARLFGYANKFAPVCLSFLMILCVSDAMRVETYVWLIGNVGYITVIALIFLYLNIIFNEEEGNTTFQFWQNKKIHSFFVGILALCIGLWTENVTIGFFAANILLAIQSYIKNKKISTSIWYGLVGCVLSFLILFGSKTGLDKTTTALLGIRHLVIQNTSGIIKLLIVDNLPIFLICFLVFIAWVVFEKKGTKNKIFRIISVLFAAFTVLIILAKMMLTFVAVKWYLPVGGPLNRISITFFDTSKPFPMIFGFAILLFFLMAIFLSPLHKEKLLVLYCIGMGSAGVMAVAPYLGARIFVITIFMLISITTYFASTIKIKSIDLSKAAVLLIILLTLLYTKKYFYYGKYVKEVETIRLQLIDSYRSRIANGITTKDEWLVLPEYKEDAVIQSANPGANDFYTPILKRYYHLPIDAKVITNSIFAVKDFTATPISGNNYRFEIIPLHGDQFTYTFFVRKDGESIYESEPKSVNFDYYEFTDSGSYTVTCVLSLPSGQKEIYAFNSVEIK